MQFIHSQAYLKAQGMVHVRSGVAGPARFVPKDGHPLLSGVPFQCLILPITDLTSRGGKVGLYKRAEV